MSKKGIRDIRSTVDKVSERSIIRMTGKKIAQNTRDLESYELAKSNAIKLINLINEFKKKYY
jgi:hypothetical protein